MFLQTAKKLIREALGRLSAIARVDVRAAYNKEYGILQFETAELSGEYFLVHKILRDLFEEVVVFDVGANEGDYANLILGEFERRKIFCFEPHPKTFARLKSRLSQKEGVVCVQSALGAVAGQMTLYDYASGEGSSHASLYSSVLTMQHGADSVSAYDVPVDTIDALRSRLGVSSLTLLKIDAEGHELECLKGAINSIEAGRIALVHFEFNEMNVVSRSFLFDFYQILPGFSFYRLRQDGLLRLGAYNARHEVFQYQNILAASPEVAPLLEKYVVKAI
ncbi:MAG: FkbM family methyltransferase [Afipia sp.]|nr:FkbM family methyltransferase [Afipia sp.]